MGGGGCGLGEKAFLLKNPLFINGWSFPCLTFLNGEGEIISEEQKIRYKKGDSFFIPAIKNKYIIEGESEFLVVGV